MHVEIRAYKKIRLHCKESKEKQLKKFDKEFFIL